MGLENLREARQVHRKVALGRSSKLTKYEIQGPHGDPVQQKKQSGGKSVSLYSEILTVFMHISVDSMRSGLKFCVDS